MIIFVYADDYLYPVQLCTHTHILIYACPFQLNLWGLAGFCKRIPNHINQDEVFVAVDSLSENARWQDKNTCRMFRSFGDFFKRWVNLRKTIYLEPTQNKVSPYQL